MRKALFRALVGAVAVVGLTPPAQAELVPSFDLSYAKQKATHVVVVDGDGVVLEVWRGDLAKGDKLPFKAGEKPINVVNPLPGEPGDPKVAAVTGSRRVLFLTRGRNGEAWTPASFPKPELRLATVWIEEGHCFAIYQFRNPGAGAQMHPLYMEEQGLKDEVLAGNFETVILVEGKGQNPSLLYLVLTQPNADTAKRNEVVAQYAGAALRVAAEHGFEGAVKGGKSPRHKGNVVFLVRSARNDRRGPTTGFGVEQLREIAAATPAEGRDLAGQHAWTLGTIPDGK
jgi:hypothetical protein